MDEKEARRIIEGLRSGIPLPSLARKLPMGRERLLEGVRADLASLAEGETGSRSLIIRAPYGEGKTHLLQAMGDLAATANFVVSYVSLSKETPLDRLDRLYPAVLRGTYRPGATLPGITAELDRLREKGSLLADLERNRIPDRIRAVIWNRLDGSNPNKELLDQDLAGDFLKAQDLRAYHRTNLGRSLHLESFRPARDVIHYFRAIDQLIQRLGYAGWVILFDEVELLGKLGPLARSRAYANLAAFRRGDLPGTYTVWAVADTFYHDILSTKGDAVKAPERLRVRGEEAAAQEAAATIADLLGATYLPELEEEEIGRVLAEIRAAHALAYGWEPGIAAAELHTELRRRLARGDTRLRTLVRHAVWWLDLRLQYGVDPELTTTSLFEEDLTAATEAEPGTEFQDGVYRNRLFPVPEA